MKNLGFSELGRRTTDPPISWLMRMAREHPGLISLAAGFTDDVSLPVSETRDLLDRLLSSQSKGRSSLQYGPFAAGDAQLRHLTSERLRLQDGGATNDAAYKPDRMLVTHGSQQLLYLITECLCDPGDIVIVEDPTYFVFLGILQSHGLRCHCVRLEKNGLNLNHLESVLRSLQRTGDLPRVKLLYLVSYFQNPSGVTTDFEKKRAALELLRSYEKAAGHPIYLIEDAAYRDLRFSGEDVPSSLAVERAEERVIYTGTYSKPFATGIRVGYGLMPIEMFKVALRIKGNHDFGTSNLLQQVLVEALSSKVYGKHVEVLQRRYHRKAQTMASALRRHFPKSVTWTLPDGGLYIWARLSGRMVSGAKSKLFRRALEHDVLYVPGELCYAEDKSRKLPRNEMRLSFGGAAENRIKEGIARLANAIREVGGGSEAAF